MIPGDSLQARLLRGLLVPLALAWLATLVGGYLLTERTLNRQLDARLEEIANSIAEAIETRETVVSIRADTDDHPRDGVEFQIWQRDRIVRLSPHAPSASFADAEGFSDQEVENREWRVFSARRSDSRVVVGEDLRLRRALVRGLLWSSFSPMLIAFPLIALILWLSVGAGLRPLTELARAIRRRSPSQLDPIDLAAVPREALPVVQSLNGLLSVVEQAFARERQFADDAAHELRTPLAAIKAQAQVALRSRDEREIRESLQAVDQAVERASRMVTQLLALARLGAENLQLARDPVELRALVTGVIARLAPAALAKGVELGLADSGPLTAPGDPAALELMISNLIDNAIRYSPRGGEVAISLERAGGEARLRVEDEGPGIPPEDRERVFERFVRLSATAGEVEGSGIGLAIVRRIVALHHGRIDLAAPTGGAGLIAQVWLPLSS